MPTWLYEKEMEQVIGLLFKVQNEMGTGWSEEIFHQAVVYLTQKNGIPTQSKPRQALVHRNIEIHTFEPDVLVWDKIILELKVLLDYQGKNFPAFCQAQLFHYLKFYEMKLGALVNFAHPRVGIKRMLYDPTGFEIEENYERMFPHVQEDDRQILREVQKHIKNLGNLYGVGYPETLYRKLIAVELSHHHIPCVSDLNIPITFEGHRLGSQSTPYLLIADRFLLCVRSSLNNIPPHEVIKTHTYLNALGLRVGWIVNFGKDKLQIHATAIK